MLNKIRLLFGLALMIPAQGLAQADVQPPLSFGAFPNLSARQVIASYQPLARELEKQLNRRVVVYSAPDFRTFVERTHAGQYDIVATAPHLAWLARQEAGYRPLLKYTTPTHGLLVVRADTTFNTVDALRGKTLARANAMAVTALAVQSALADKGLRKGTDYTILNAGTHNNAVMQVLNGRAEAAALGYHPYKLLAEDLRQKLRIVLETPPVSSLMLLSHPRLSDADAQAVRQALHAFEHSTEGREFMKRGGYGGFTPVSGDELQAFHAYALEVRELLRSIP